MEELKLPRPSDSTGRPKSPLRQRRDAAIKRLRGAYPLLARAVRGTVLSALAHDCLNMAQSIAYSAIVALFPALIVAAAVIGLLPDTAPVRFQLAGFFDRVLPPGVSQLLDAAFENSPKHAHSLRALISAGVVSFLGASNVIATLMEGFRRARNLPLRGWTFWQRRLRSFELVPLSLVPLMVASLLVVFGHAVTGWLESSIGPDLRASIYVLAFLIRWGIPLSASVGLIALIYHLGVPDGYLQVPGIVAGQTGRMLIRPQTSSKPAAAVEHIVPRSWRAVLPGAVMATAMWFLTTLGFGWYLTRFANYSEVYGSLGAGIALLFWLYIISLSVLCGAEFNAHFDAGWDEKIDAKMKNDLRSHGDALAGNLSNSAEEPSLAEQPAQSTIAPARVE